MKYLVMECHPGYAVVLDEEGKFLKVANNRYEVGQTVMDVVPMQLLARKKPKKWLYSLAAMAACLALILGLTLPGTHQPYASVYVKINPEVRIDVDKQDTVVGLVGVNQDGVDLIAGYDYHEKHLDLVTDELVDRAIDMGYLHSDGQITISLDSQDQVWIEHHSQSISSHLQTHLQERIVVTIQIEQCTHDHTGDAHHGDDDDDDDDDDDEDEEDDDIYVDPENPNRVIVEPDLEDDDDQEREHEDHDDHDDHEDHDDSDEDDEESDDDEEDDD